MNLKKMLNWNAYAFFEGLCEKNRLAQEIGMKCCSVSGLQGFENALHLMQECVAFCCVSDEADGYTTLANTPHTRRVKTVFLAMRHAIDNEEERRRAFEVLREIFRQFASKLVLERTRIEQNHIYIDGRITFREVDRYFFSGCACAYFQIATEIYTDLRMDESEWRT